MQRMQRVTVALPELTCLRPRILIRLAQLARPGTIVILLIYVHSQRAAACPGPARPAVRIIP